VNYFATIEDYADALAGLPENISDADVTCPELRMYHDEKLSIYFAPFPGQNPAGRVLLCAHSKTAAPTAAPTV
jgi:hypothetical protein